MPLAEVEAHIEEQCGTLEVLATALECGDAARVRAALDHDEAREALSWRDEDGATLLHLTVPYAKDRWDVQALVEQIVRLGADVAARDRLGWTPLHAAARAGAASACLCLLGAGADVHARGGLGATPLEVSSGEEVRLALLQAGAELMPSRGASRASSRGSASSGSSVPSTALHSARRRAGATGSAEGMPSVDGLGEALSRAATIDGTVAGLTPHPPPSSSRPSSSRHAQRLRAKVAAEAG